MKTWLICLWALILIVHVVVVSSILLQDRPIIWPLHNDTIHRMGTGVDLYGVYHAALNERRGLNPYDFYNLDGITPYWEPYRYLPIVAIAAEPLTWLSPGAARVVWGLLLEAFLAILLVTLWKRIADKRVRLITIALLLVNTPYFLEVYMGQFTFLAISLCCLSVLMVARGQAVYCASALLKPLTFAVVPALLRERRYWGHAISAIACVALLTVPYFVRHPEQRGVHGREFPPRRRIGRGQLRLCSAGGPDRGGLQFFILVESLVCVRWMFSICGANRDRLVCAIGEADHGGCQRAGAAAGALSDVSTCVGTPYERRVRAGCPAVDGAGSAAMVYRDCSGVAFDSGVAHPVCTAGCSEGSGSGRPECGLAMVRIVPDRAAESFADDRAFLLCGWLPGR